MGNERQQLNNAEWKGYVKRALEDSNRRLGRIEGKVDSLIWKVAGIGATVALLVSLVFKIVGG